MRKINVLWAVTAIAAAVLAFVGASCARAPAKKEPAAGILFVDRAAVLRDSSVGKDMYAQSEVLAKQMETDFKPENAALQADILALQTKSAYMTSQQRQAKVNELEARRQAFQKKLQDRQEAIRGGLAKARTQVEEALGPILDKIMADRSANLLLDRGLVVRGATDLDITPIVIERLDAALPKVTVTLASP